jgi:hypothetical protein
MRYVINSDQKDLAFKEIFDECMETVNGILMGKISDFLSPKLVPFQE